MSFKPLISPSAPEPNQSSLWFIFSNQKLLIQSENNGVTFPHYSEIKPLLPDCSRPIYFGSMEGTSCYAAEYDPEEKDSEILSEFAGVRSLYGQLKEDEFKAAGYALHLLTWEKTLRFCSCCGHPVVDKTDERAKICPNCGYIAYPRISPAIIVAVLKGDQILLARSNRYQNRKLYSVIAGYLEIGETLEECVKREVKEEVGISIKNIQYFGSQPWPYSNAMMIGFTAEYEDGVIQADHDEIQDAAWFSADNLPDIPPKGSIANQLIDWFSGQFCRKV